MLTQNLRIICDPLLERVPALNTDLEQRLLGMLPGYSPGNSLDRDIVGSGGR